MFNWLKNLLFPIQCLGGCGRYDQWLCRPCATLTFQPQCATGQTVGIPLLHHVTALGRYRNPLLRRCIVELKYSGYFEIATVLGKALRQIIPLTDYDYIIPVPLHWHRQRERGFNQTALLAKQLSGTVIVLPALKKSRSTKTQATLQRHDRLRNLNQAFRLQPKLLPLLRQRRVLLIDDVLSTGATLTACAEQLQTAGCARIDAAVIALNI